MNDNYEIEITPVPNNHSNIKGDIYNVEGGGYGGEERNTKMTATITPEQIAGADMALRAALKKCEHSLDCHEKAVGDFGKAVELAETEKDRAEFQQNLDDATSARNQLIAMIQDLRERIQ